MSGSRNPQEPGPRSLGDEPAHGPTIARTHDPAREIRLLEGRGGSERDPEGRSFAPLADAYRRDGRLEEAAEVVEEGTTRLPDFVTGHVVAGLVHRDRGDSGAARASFERALELDPANRAALRGMAELHLDQGDREAAGRSLDRLEAAGGDASELGRRLDAPESSSEAAPLLEQGTLADDDLLGGDDVLGGSGLPTGEGDAGGDEILADEDVLADDEALVDDELLAGDNALLGDESAGDDPSAGEEPVLDLSSLDALTGGEDQPAPANSDAPSELDPLDLAGAGPGSREEASWEDFVSDELPLEEPPTRDPGGDEEAVEPGRPSVLDGEGGPVTRTMGDLYAAQGHLEEAVYIYERLVEREPDDPELAGRLEELRARAEGEPDALAKPGGERTDRSPEGGDPGDAPDDREEPETLHAPQWVEEQDRDALEQAPSPFAWAQEHAGTDETTEGSPVVREPMDEPDSSRPGRTARQYFQDLLAWVPGAVPIESLRPEVVPVESLGPEGDSDRIPPVSEGDRPTSTGEQEPSAEGDLDDFHSWLGRLGP